MTRKDTDNTQQWLTPATFPPCFSLPSDEVHVWLASLEMSPEIVARLRPYLVEDELSRAEQFYFERDRRRWIIARAVLRTLLARYLGSKPRELRFSTNAYGKPALDLSSSFQLDAETTSLQFNLSHSHEVALYAFARGRMVGIDVEYMRTDIDCYGLAKVSFSQNEQQMLHALPASLLQRGFYQCWTRKEAYIKARGMGLSLPLDTFDVSLGPDVSARLLACRESPNQILLWHFRDLPAIECYERALLVERAEDASVRCWRWTENFIT